MLARKLAHPVRRDRGTVGIGLVVELGQGVDEVEVVATVLQEATGALAEGPRRARSAAHRAVNGLCPRFGP